MVNEIFTPINGAKAANECGPNKNRESFQNCIAVFAEDMCAKRLDVIEKIGSLQSSRRRINVLSAGPHLTAPGQRA